MWKNPNSFMKVPSSANTTGTPSTIDTSASTRASAGARQRPRRCGWFWNCPVSVV